MVAQHDMCLTCDGPYVKPDTLALTAFVEILPKNSLYLERPVEFSD